MVTTRVTRRGFLLGSTALAVVGVVASGPVTAACADLHRRVAAEWDTLVRSTSLAAANLRSMMLDMTCPGCGEPFVRRHPA